MMKPLIGISVDHVRHFPQPDRDRSYLKLYPQYCNAIVAAGGTPLVIPIVPDVDDIRPLVDLVQGVVIVGGDDYPPEWFGKRAAPTDNPVTQERAEFDKRFADLVFGETDLPVLGVCGGMQLSAIWSGGTLVQNLPAKGPIIHRAGKDGYRYHDIDIVPDSVFARAVGATRIRVNSLHHQAVEYVKDPLVVSARAPDGVVEVVEFKDHPFRVGVQWHPERMDGDDHMQRLFRAFVIAARERLAVA